MEAIGHLAGGIAHDFNNLLGAVTGFAGFLAEDLPEGSDQHQFATRILMACQQAKQLVGEILAFARAGHVERQSTDIGAVLRDSCKLLLATLPSSTRLHVDITDEKLLVLGNEAQLGQVAANLCINANDALAGEPGSISVALATVRRGDADYALVNDEATSAAVSSASHHVVAGRLDEDRDYARITVGDTAGGIVPALLPRIFEPFFTTKERGRGTGLGLAAVHGIVMSYEGAYRVESRPGSGTDFSIYLPLAGADRIAAVAMEIVPPDIRGRERILIVDDERDVVDMMSIGLERLGYEVASADNPADALEAFADDPTAWDLVVSDQTMPGMTGLSLIAELKSLRPDIEVILCTGFSDGTIERSARELGVDCLLKPVEPHRLAARIRVLMDRRAKGAKREKEATWPELRQKDCVRPLAPGAARSSARRRSHRLPPPPSRATARAARCFGNRCCRRRGDAAPRRRSPQRPTPALAIAAERHRRR
jgi:two-component system cell cycle sensor histidine kinase/response regulator CckA